MFKLQIKFKLCIRTWLLELQVSFVILSLVWSFVFGLLLQLNPSYREHQSGIFPEDGTLAKKVDRVRENIQILKDCLR